MEAVKSCGANLTRACVMKFLNTTGPFTPGGFLTPNKPSEHDIYTADLIVQAKGGKFVEVPKPSGAKGPPGGEDFWDTSALMDWFKYYCSHRNRFINQADKDRVVKC